MHEGMIGAERPRDLGNGYTPTSQRGLTGFDGRGKGKDGGLYERTTCEYGGGRLSRSRDRVSMGCV